MIVLLYLLYTAALASALYCAHKMISGDAFHAAALALALFIANLMLPPSLAGLVGQLNPLGLVFFGVLVWGAQIAFVRKRAPLPAPHFTPPTRYSLPLRALRVLGVALCLTLLCMLAGFVLIAQSNLSSTDAVYHYVPNMINLVQSGTLFEFNGMLPFFPLGFEALLSWEMAFTRTFLHTNAIHTVLYLGTLLYGITFIRYLLRSAPEAARTLGTIGGVLLLLTMNVHVIILGGTGKNDLLMWMVALASVYYLLRYWDDLDERWLVLLGIHLGLGASSKLTGVTWIAVLALLHLALLFRHHQLRQLMRHALRIGVPVLALFSPWGIRILVSFASGQRSTPELTRIGAEHTFLRQLFTPEFTAFTSEWLPWFIIIVGALAVLLWLPKSLHRFAGVILLTAFTIFFINARFSFYQGGVAVAVCTGIMIGLHAWRRRDSLALPLGIIAVVILLSTATLVVTPYSAWVYYDHANVSYFMAINYRFSPATGALIGFALITLVINRLTPTTAAPRPIDAPRTTTALFIALFPSILAMLLLQNIIPRTLPAFLTTDPPAPRPSPTVQEWVDANICNATIYSINEAPILLYGRDLSNRVYYVFDGYEEYFGAQAYRWDDLQRLIAEYDIDYIVARPEYHLAMQAALAFTPEVQAEIDQMRGALTTVFDNGVVSIFSTQAVASGCPSPITSAASR